MILALVGPTGVGKSALSLKLAKTLETEILSVDALQVYQEFNIGTAKLPLEDREGIIHHFLDHVQPDEAYNVAIYQKEARAQIERLERQGKTPFFVGGSGFYLKAVLHDFEFPPLQKQEFTEGDSEERHAYLATLDPVAAKKIHPNNRKRVEQAILKASQGQPLSLQTKGHEALYDYLIIGLRLERETLYTRVNKRVDEMIEQGLEEEARHLQHLAHPTAFDAIGYKEWQPYFAGQTTREDVIETIKRHTRRYVKKQMTYFQNQLPITWVDVEDRTSEDLHDEIMALIHKKIQEKNTLIL